jgi:arsenical pump membrane protein
VAVGGFVLLGAGVAGAVTRPWRVPAWVAPVVAVAVAACVGLVDAPLLRSSLDPLVAPLAFLLLAVPLAALLDRAGVFDALAAVASRRSHVVGGLWLLCIVTTAVLNLDAAVVLLTPLAIRTARRMGMSPVALAVQPVLLACLASSFLPVSNLTNLIASDRLGLHPLDFLVHLGPATLAGLAVGWRCYRRAYPIPEPTPSAAVARVPVDRPALRLGAVVVAVLLVGFLAGPALGVPPWAVVAVVDLALIARLRHVPVGAVPWGTALVAAGLAVLAGAAVANVPVGDLLHGSGPGATVRVAGLGALGANAFNNLPAFLVGVARLPHGSPLVWPLLLGVNAGPTLLVTGSLASLLWLDVVRRSGLSLGAPDYFRLGVRVGVPALVASVVVLAAGDVGSLWTVVALAVVGVLSLRRDVATRGAG